MSPSALRGRAGRFTSTGGRRTLSAPTGGGRGTACPPRFRPTPALRRSSTRRRGGFARSPDTRASALFYEEEGRFCSLPLDAALPVLHGKYGEDGTVQGLLELAGIPVIGCGVLASALCMDKALTHTVARAAGVAVPEGRVVRSAEGCDPEAFCYPLFVKPLRGGSSFGITEVREGSELREAVERALVRSAEGCDPEAFCYPLFVKPLRGGSSFGITEVREGSELREAVERALAFDGAALLEEKIDGFEVGCAVLGTGELTLGEVDEIGGLRGTRHRGTHPRRGGRDRACRRLF